MSQHAHGDSEREGVLGLEWLRPHPRYGAPWTSPRREGMRRRKPSWSAPGASHRTVLYPQTSHDEVHSFEIRSDRAGEMRGLPRREDVFSGSSLYHKSDTALGRLDEAGVMSGKLSAGAGRVFFFFLFNHYWHATYLDHGEIMYSPFPVRCLRKLPFALHPGLSHEDVERTKKGKDKREKQRKKRNLPPTPLVRTP